MKVFHRFTEFFHNPVENYLPFKVTIKFQFFLFLWCPSDILHFHTILLFYFLLFEFVKVVIEILFVISCFGFSHWFEMCPERCLESSARDVDNQIGVLTP